MPRISAIAVTESIIAMQYAGIIFTWVYYYYDWTTTTTGLLLDCVVSIILLLLQAVQAVVHGLAPLSEHPLVYTHLVHS